MKKTFWQDRPTLVTGATGQLGGWLVNRLLEEGADVVCLVRDWVPQSLFVTDGLMEQVKIVRGELGDQALMERILGEYEIDTIIHLAAQSIVGVANRNPVFTFETNIRGTWLLLEAARRSPTVKQIVLASTDKSYGSHDELPYHEEMPLQPLYPHDVSKACADMIGQSYAATYEMNVGITRLPNLYGGGDLNWNRIVPGTIRSALRGQRPVIHSDGKFIRDYLYVEDAVDAHLVLAQRLAERPDLRGEVFNISSESWLTVLELVERILAHIDPSLEPIVEDRVKHEIRNQYLSAAKARELLGWRPLFDLDEGLQRTVDWYRAFFMQHL